VKFAAASPTDTFALTDDQLKRFVSGAVPELDPQAVKLMMVPAIEMPDPEPTGELLSAGALKATVATLAVLFVAMSAISIALLLRLRKLRPVS